MDRLSKARVSRAADFIATAAVVVLLYAWISDRRYNTGFLSPSFYATGFCNSPTQNTQELCWQFDAAAGIVFLLLSLKKGRKCLSLTAYCWAHGYGHYLMETGQPPPEITMAGGLTMAAILAIGPAKGMGTAVAAGIDKATAARVAVLMEVLLVLVYVLGLGKTQAGRNHGLLYINITITFCVSLPRLLFVGTSEESELVLRSDLPYFWGKMATKLGVAITVVIEPLFCDSVLAAIGGHFLFDVALFLDSLMDALNEPASTTVVEEAMKKDA